MMSEPASEFPAKQIVTRWRIPWEFLIPVVLVLVILALLIPAIEQAREAARATQCKNNLKQAGLAFLNFHDAFKSFPPAYRADADGKPAHSWRMLIRPFVDASNIYNEYDFDAPWNGPTNSKLSKDNPIYRCPSSENQTSLFHTNYVAISGSHTIFPAAQSVRLDEIKDGPNNTIIIAEITGSDIPWMEPRDLMFDEMSFVINDPAKPSISSPHPGGVHVLFADGSVRFLSSENLSPEMVKAMLPISGGEEIEDLH